MVLELKLRKIGNSVGVVLPREALQHLAVGEGDALFLTVAPDASVRLTATSPEVGRQLEAAQSVIRRYRRTLRELAK
jgi:putative addiction module antidote